LWVVVGLGNPGRSYLNTRHNVGFSFIKRLEKEWKVRAKKIKYFSKVTEFAKNKKKILLVKPQTYMNKSGLAVKKILKERGLKPEQLIIVYDDLDIPLGEIRVRKKGTAGSHKGMISIIQEVEAVNMPRIRIGIGPLPSNEDATDFVLSPFKKDERSILKKSMTKAQKALEMILSGDVNKAMNIYNQTRKAFSD
jgi:PTH1 family peptidyl-tRNA hydrolase